MGMRSPRPGTVAWVEWKANRLPGESYMDFVNRTRSMAAAAKAPKTVATTKASGGEKGG